MKMKTYLWLIVFVASSCVNQNKPNQTTSKPVSCKIYRLGFIDERYCKNCVSAMFFKAISTGTLSKSNNLAVDFSVGSRVEGLYKCFRDATTKTIGKTVIDNRFMVVFQFADSSRHSYSWMSEGNWLLDDSISVIPKRDVLQVIREQEQTGDLTDYRYVSRGPQPISE
jgi:hypothetical protein